MKGSAEADIKKIMQNSNDLVANLGDLVNKINDITRKIDQGEGTIGKFINDPSMFNKLNRTVEEAQTCWPRSNLVKGQLDGSFLTGSSMTR